MMTDVSAGFSHPAALASSCRPNDISVELFARLAQDGIGYAVYKNTGAIDAALAGSTDLDILVAEEDLPVFRAVLKEFGGIRGFPSALYDNAIAEREDWFVPAGRTRAIHLDLAHAIMTGPKFNKRYRALTFRDIGHGPVSVGEPAPVPRVALDDEARIALVRAAFRLHSWSLRRWLRVTGELERVVRLTMPQGSSEHVFLIELGRRTVSCPARIIGSQLFLSRRAMGEIRSVVRAQCGIGWIAAGRDMLVHLAKRGSFSVLRRLTQHSPGRAANKRRFERGRVVALVGPDGVGKSTQVARLAKSFGHKFRCTSIYLGSNDGSWMKYRGKLKLGPARNAATDKSKSPDGKKRKDKRGFLHSLGSAIWRLIIAGNRYLAVRRALRLTASGALVITDRWPQNIAEGILDGPSKSPPAQFWLATMLWRAEKRLYRNIVRHTPSLTIHLDCDYETSHQRKPGDIERVDFELRIALMKTMREHDPGVLVVDGRMTADEVTAQLFALIWQHLQGKQPEVAALTGSRPEEL